MSESNLIAVSDTLIIPFSEIDFTFSPSRGPGGQHANRSHTRVTLQFNIASSPSLDEAARQKLLDTLAVRLDKKGVVSVTVQDSRSQSRNRELAIARFVNLINEALQETAERVPTSPPAAADEERLEEKRKKSQRKRERSKDWSQDD